MCTWGKEHAHKCSALKGQKGALEHLELDLHMVVSHPK